MGHRAHIAKFRSNTLEREIIEGVESEGLDELNELLCDFE
jgi:hypothetical protein